MSGEGQRRRIADEAILLDLPVGSAHGAQRFEITYGPLGTGTDRHAVGAGTTDRPRTGSELGTCADARANGTNAAGFGAARPGMAPEYAANTGPGRRRLPGSLPVGLQLWSAGF